MAGTDGHAVEALGGEDKGSSKNNYTILHTLHRQLPPPFGRRIPHRTYSTTRNSARSRQHHLARTVHNLTQLFLDEPIVLKGLPPLPLGED